MWNKLFLVTGTTLYYKLHLFGMSVSKLDKEIQVAFFEKCLVGIIFVMVRWWLRKGRWHRNLGFFVTK